MNLNLNELFSFREPRWFENIVGVSFLTALVAMGFVVLAVAGGNGSFLEGAGLVGAFATCIFGVPSGCFFVSRHESQRKEAINARLAPLTTTQLVALSSSPEVDEWNRALLVDFLNKNRGGWSFAIDTVNTTR